MAKQSVDVALPIEFSEVVEVVYQDLLGTNGKTLGGLFAQAIVQGGIFNNGSGRDRLTNFVGYTLPAASNSAYAIFGGGKRNTTIVKMVEKYNFTNDTVTAGTSLAYDRANLSAVGDSTHGFFAAGTIEGAHYTDKYNYSNDTVSSGTKLTSVRGLASAAGNNIAGYFRSGLDNHDIGQASEKYIYSSNSVTLSVSLTSSLPYGMSSAGNLSYGMWVGGVFYGEYSERFEYSNETAIPSVTPGILRMYAAGTGNSSLALVGGGKWHAGGGSNYVWVDKWVLSANTVSQGTNLGNSRQTLAASGNSITGLWVGGYGGSTSSSDNKYVDKYTFATNVRVQGTSLSVDRARIAGCSPTENDLGSANNGGSNPWQ